MESYEHKDASEALAAIDLGRAAAADRLVTPWWYHPLLGLLSGGYIVLVLLGGSVGTIIAVPVFFGALYLLVRAYKKRNGVWISGLAAGPARRWSIILMITMVVLVCVAYVAHVVSGAAWPIWTSAVAVAVAVNVFGYLFDHTLRASLRAQTSE